MLSFVIFFSSAVSCISAQAITPGYCPEIPALDASDFNITTAAAGKWYQYAGISQPIFENWKCIEKTSVYFHGAWKLTYKAINKFTNYPESMVRIFTVVDSDKAVISVNILDNTVGLKTMTGQVVSIDYGCYWIQYGSIQADKKCYQFSWINTRDRIPTPECRYKLEYALKESGIDQSLYQKTVQSDCPNEY